MTRSVADASSMAATGSAASPLKRRGVLLGAAAAAGATLVAAKVLPGSSADAAGVAAPAKAPESGGGYRLTAHVQRYYDTARS
jgi:hypothetical protein